MIQLGWLRFAPAPAGAADRPAARPAVARGLRADRRALPHPGRDDGAGRRGRRRPRPGAASRPALRRDGRLASLLRGGGGAPWPRRRRTGGGGAALPPRIAHHHRLVVESAGNARARQGGSRDGDRARSTLSGRPRIRRGGRASASGTRSRPCPPNLRAEAPVLFSAHGLPEAYIRRGDPYLDDVRITVAAVSRAPGAGRARAALLPEPGRPAKWLAPTPRRRSTRWPRRARARGGRPDRVHGRAHRDPAGDRHPLQRARHARGHRHFARARTVGCHPAFIAALADLVEATAPRAAGRTGARCGSPSSAAGSRAWRPRTACRARATTWCCVEDAAAPGGLIAGERRDGFLCERGPQAMLDGARETRALIDAAGLCRARAGRRARGAAALHLRRRRAAPSPRARPRWSDRPAVGGAASGACSPSRSSGAAPPTSRCWRSSPGGSGARRPSAPRRPPDRGVRGRRGGAVGAQRPAPRGGDGARARQHPARHDAPEARRGMGHPVSFPGGLGELPAALAQALGARRRRARAAEIARSPAAGA